MPRKPVEPEPEITTRRLAPAQPETDGSLYRAVPQLEQFPPEFKIKYLWLTPPKAKELLSKANRTKDFKQRPVRLAQVRRWRALMSSKRFVHFLPATPLLIDPDGVMLNGQHRMLGMAELPDDVECGFIVFENVPRWMFAFFDTNSARSLKDVFHSNSRPTRAQSGSMMKLAMRYEEFITGRRNPGGWRNWNMIKDEHQDIDDFFARRLELQDWYAVGEAVKKATQILIPSTAVFQFYQSLAWPDGFDEIKEFTDNLIEGVNMPPAHPARLLREWAMDTWLEGDQVFAKRETHLMLLFRAFEQVQNGTRPPKLNWAYGMPMTMPYHPKGFEVAIKNVRMALDDMDANAPA